jgi:hypothetical protein
VVVLANGGVVTLEPWHDRVDAILETWAAGQAGGGAITDVLTGVVNPSGRLAETIPLALSDTPAYLNFPGEHQTVRYGEGVFVGYRYYTSTDRPVRYPFGHGLSYTEFVYDTLEAQKTGPDTARVHVTVRNAGPVAGAHIVQVYVAPAAAPVRRPARELAAFTKVHLEPGQATTATLDLDRRVFAFWDEPNARWWVQPGEYRIQVGTSAADITHQRPITIDGDTERPPPLSLDATVEQWFNHPVAGPVLMQGMREQATEEQLAAADAGLKMVASMPMSQFARFPGVDISEETLQRLIALSA